MDILSYVASLIFVIALIAAGAWLLKGFLVGGQTPASKFFSQKEKRIGVVEAASVDGRRKLVIVRRDNVEHLIMTGGPVDVVIETGFSANSARQAGPTDHIADNDDGEEIFVASDGRRSVSINE